MTSVNTGPAPYTVGYERNHEKPAPIRYQDSAEAAEHAGMLPNAAPPRPPMSPEQRGQFSSHSKIVNQQQSQGAHSAGQLAELTQKNQELRTKFQGFAAQVGPQIQNLQKQVVDLTQQLNTPDKATQDASNEPGGAPQNRSAAEPGVVQSDASPSTQDASGTPPGQTQSLEELTRQSKEFREEVKNFFLELSTVIQQLREQIQGLAQRIETIQAPQTPTPSAPESTAETASSPETAPLTHDEAAAPTNDEMPPSSNEPQEPASRGVEELMHENAQFQAALDQMDAAFKQEVSNLQQQIEILTKKISEQKP